MSSNSSSSALFFRFPPHKAKAYLCFASPLILKKLAQCEEVEWEDKHYCGQTGGNIPPLPLPNHIFRIMQLKGKKWSVG